MFPLCLAQSAPKTPTPPGPEAGLFSLLLIGALLSIGLLVLIGLIAAWRNYISRQRDLEFEHEQRMANLPKPDAWSTAAQRLDPPESDSSQAHIAHDDNPEDRYTDQDDDEDDEDDDFPFDINGKDDNDDDDGPIGRA
jgi:hypothetical protein